MTAVLAGHPPSWAGSSKDHGYYAMSSDQTDPDWRQQYYHHLNSGMPVLSSSWAGTVNPSMSHPPSMGGMTDVDLRMFQQPQQPPAPPHQDHTPHFEPGMPYPSTSQLISPTITYASEASWPTDMDMGTPSTASFPPDLPDGFHHTLRLPTHPNHHNQSPHSSIDGFSPHPATAAGSLPDHARPGIYRAVTTPSHRRTVTAATASSDLTSGLVTNKRSEPSEDGDDDLPTSLEHDGIYPMNSAVGDHRASTASAPSGTASATTRGRKRTRIPHTAVERRYRENLNAHLDRLRQTVPAFNQPHHPGGSRSGVTGAGGAGVGDELVTVGAGGSEGGAGAAVSAAGMRPSKCEILNGAIEHILNLDKENSSLKTENEALRTRLAEVDRWYLQQQVGPSGGPRH